MPVLPSGTSVTVVLLQHGLLGLENITMVDSRPLHQGGEVGEFEAARMDNIACGVH